MSFAFPRLLITAFFAAVLPLSAQTLTTGEIAGTVLDSSGAVVRGATVRLESLEAADIRTLPTNTAGEFRFPLLKPGEYLLTAAAPGLSGSPARIRLLVGQQPQVNLTLSPEAAKQAVSVTAESPLIEAENANQATSYGERQIEAQPVNGGDITNIAFSTPGLRLNVGGGNTNFNVNGLPFSSALFTVNGADITEPYNLNNKSGASNNTLGANDIAEAAVVVNAFSAQYGRMAGAQVNYVTKSGSDRFHGTLLENYNGSLLNANDFFNNATRTPRGRSVANQYAGSLGGPVWKQHTWFHINAEGLRYALPSNGVVSLPSPQFEQYVLAHVPAASVPLYQDVFSLYNNAPGANRAVPVTTGSGLLQDGTGNLGCGRQKFVGTYLNGASGPRFGVDAPCAVAFGTNVSNVNTESYVSGRLDHNITASQRIYFRISDDWGLQASSTSPITPLLNRQSDQPWIIPQLNHTWVITPNLVNNAVVSGNWYSVITGVPDFQKAQALLPENFTISDGGANGGGFSSLAAALPTGRRGQQLQLIDDLSWTLGTHTLQFGVNQRNNRVSDSSIASGAIVGTYTFNDLTDFATGQVNSTSTGSKFTQSYPLLQVAHIRLDSLNFYVQDQWAIRRNLKVTYGIRFELNGNPSCQENCFSRFAGDFSGQTGAAVPYNATIRTGLSNTYAKQEGVISEPRLGVAWSPRGPGKTVVRAGVGLFANTPAGNVAASVFGNAPNKFTPTVSFGSVGLPSDPNSSAAAAAASNNAFFAGFSQGYTLTQLQAALGKVPFGLPSFYEPPADFRSIKVLEWSLEIEQPIGGHDVFALTYSGNHGYDEPLTNSAANAYIATPSRYPNGFGGLPTAAPDPRFSAVTQILTTGYSNYDGLILQLRHAFHRSVQGQLSYTWSHALELGTIYNPLNPAFGYSDAPFDTRHNLTADFVWNSPRIRNRFTNAALGGWTLGSKIYLYSGRPFSVTNSQIPGLLSANVGTTVLADLLDPSLLFRGCTDVNQACFSSTQFAASSATSANPHQQVDFGNTQPNAFRGPGFFSVAAQLTKRFALRDRAGLEIGASAFNLFNHPNFAVPNGNVTSGSFGLITSTVSSPTSIYGTGQGAIVSGRVLVLLGRITF
jgi:hypothetical protein